MNNTEAINLDRLVQCRCSDCSTDQLGYQWVSPRAKSKHRFFDNTMKPRQKTACVDDLERELSSLTIDHRQGSIKKRTARPVFRLSSAVLQKRLKQMIALKEFTVTSSALVATVAATLQDIPPANDYY